MRHSVIRIRASATVAALALACSTLTACNRLSPAGESDTMSLLKSGSEKVCIDSGVHDVLRKLILPHDLSGNGGAANEARTKAVGTVSFAYELTTLQGFDQTVSKASCNTTVQISGQDGKSSKFQLTYAISPSAEQPGGFVVTAETADASAYAALLIDAAETKLTEQQRQLADQQGHAAMVANLTDRWLTGTWIGAGNDSAECGTLEGIKFESGHVLEGALGIGRWSLLRDQLHMIGNRAGRQIDATATITTADPVSFTIRIGQDQPRSLRRCTTAEIQAADDTMDDLAAEPDNG